jgi:hypothetical protein
VADEKFPLSKSPARHDHDPAPDAGRVGDTFDALQPLNKGPIDRDMGFKTCPDHPIDRTCTKRTHCLYQ